MLKDMMKKRGITGIEVCSRATSNEEEGNPVYPPAKRELLKHGIISDGKYAEQLKKSDYDNADLFICMDENNVRSAKRIFGGDIADPWYTGNFSLTHSQIESGCNALLESIKNQKIGL